MEEEHNCSTCPIYGMCGEIERKKNIVLTSGNLNSLTPETQKLFENICKDKKILILANATSENNYKKKDIEEQFATFGAIKTTIINIDDNSMNEIFNHDVIYMLDGNNLDNLLKLIQNTYIKLFLLEFLEYGTYIGSGIGSLILDDDLEWYYKFNNKDTSNIDSFKGLNLSHYHVLPHYNLLSNEQKENIQKLDIQITPLNDGEYIME